eukprot:gene8983-biopygen18172
MSECPSEAASKATLQVIESRYAENKRTCAIPVMRRLRDRRLRDRSAFAGNLLWEGQSRHAISCHRHHATPRNTAPHRTAPHRTA